MVDGVPQRPIEGVSIAYTFAAANAPSRRTLQYFEMLGNRGIYHEGWTAVTKHRTPWLTGQIKTIPFKDDVWELYDTSKDFSQADNVAAKHPEKLAELRALFLAEAAKYQVFPLDDRSFERGNPAIAGRPDLMVGRKSMKLYNGMRLYEVGCAPNLKNITFTVTADSDRGRPVARDYSSNVFTGGSLNSVVVELGKEEPATDEHVERKYRVAMARQ
jgi:hypothetical protein